MNREIDITYNDADTVLINNCPHNPKIPVFAGYTSEDEATQLNISLPSDWTGNFYVGIKDDDWVWSTAYTDTEIEFLLPQQEHGQIIMAVKTDTVLTAPVVLEIR